VQLVGEDNLNRSTVFAWFAQTTRSVRPRKAWRVARAFAQHTGLSEQEAFKILFVEAPDPALAETPRG
jgi:hypothetical protein